MAIRDKLADRMTVEPPDTPTKDGSAGPVQSFTPVEYNVPAQITPLSDGQRATAAMAGMVVSHKARKYTARWWTQGEEPGTTGEWGVWQDNGAC